MNRLVTEPSPSVQSSATGLSRGPSYGARMTSPHAARRRSAALVLACSVGLLASTATAQATPPEREITLTPIGTYQTGAFDEGASEIVAHDARSQRVFVVNAQAGTVDVLDISDPTQPTRVTSLDAPGANSVAVHGRVIAVAEQADDKTDPGTVAFFDADSLERARTVTVGALPDMVTFTDNGRYALVANEGEPEGYCEGQVDPEGSISVIDLRRGVQRATVRTADFHAFDDRAAELRAAGVRVFGPGASVSQDLEPEFIAPSGNGRTAYVTLQEANAVAVVDIASATVTDVRPLGLKDHSVAGAGLDPSDRDDAIAIGTWPVQGMYQPDAIGAYQGRGGEYLVTANEGDAREYDCFEEESRVKDVTLSPNAFPDAAALQQNGALGRLTMTTTSPADEEGRYTRIDAFGARSVSVWDTRTGAQLWDSGDAIAQLLADEAPEIFNAAHDETGSADDRSDAKGAEPEGLDLGTVGGRDIAFVGLERASAIVAVDVTDPRSARIAGWGTNRDESGDAEAGTAGDLGPEGIHFIPAAQSPNGQPLLLVGNEVSGTTTVWQVGTGR